MPYFNATDVLTNCTTKCQMHKHENSPKKQKPSIGVSWIGMGIKGLPALKPWRSFDCMSATGAKTWPFTLCVSLVFPFPFLF